jgi:hypothetical protein
VSVPELRLQFEAALIPSLAKRYDYDDAGERHIIKVIAPAAKQRGYFTRAEFIQVCRWKTQRSGPRVRRNDSGTVEEATRIALSCDAERLRIGVLRTLEGVDWATASVFLHFGHEDRYPIIDFRALESLGIPRGTVYTFDLWIAYVRCCRDLADQTRADMRTLDRALWQWSNERNPVG